MNFRLKLSALIVMGLAGLSLSSLHRANSHFTDYANGLRARGEAADNFRRAVDDRALAVRSLLLITRPEDLPVEKSHVIAAHSRVREHLDHLNQVLAGASDVSERGRSLIVDMDKAEAVHTPVPLAIVDLALNGQKEAGIPTMNDGCRQLLSQLAKASDEYTTIVQTRSAQMAEDGAAEYLARRNLLVGACLAAGALAVVAGTLVIRRMKRPVDRSAPRPPSTAGALAALLLAAGFTRSLRRPLDELNEGVQAHRPDDLPHRIALEGADKCSAAAHDMKTTAAELVDHRSREAQAQAQAHRRLEVQVAVRTDELQGALDTLTQVDARRRRLFADISHELRTPTTVILGEAEIMLRGRDRPTDEYRSTLQRIVATSRHLGAVIDDLLTMARSDMDALALNRRELDLTEPLHQALEQARALANERGITVQAAPMDAGALPLLADPQRLVQLLLLLLDNAVRYSHAGGTVQVAVSRCDDDASITTHCEIRISDQGIGVPADELPRVFERGFRSVVARQHRADGSGLGLAIGRTLARAHGGDVTLDSQSGRGTTSVLRLPLHASTRDRCSD